jgi:hypothetical protein
VADGWCWFVLREKYCWLVADGWFVLREKYCWLIADKPSEHGVGLERDLVQPGFFLPLVTARLTAVTAPTAGVR